MSETRVIHNPRQFLSNLKYSRTLISPCQNHYNMLYDSCSFNPYPAAKMSSAKCFVWYNFQGGSKLFKVWGILSEHQTTWTRVRRRVTRRLIRIQVVCTRDYGRDRQDIKGLNVIFEALDI